MKKWSIKKKKRLEPFAVPHKGDSREVLSKKVFSTIARDPNTANGPAHPPSFHQPAPLWSNWIHPQDNNDSDEEHKLWSQLYLGLNPDPVTQQCGDHGQITSSVYVFISYSAKWG